ncbi:MAG: hypothetical protein Ct9H300mP32_2870 [Verrucomicrobiota bacterium]|nr:MAG: hypothetical protein Ct9H300mP32_2870 [Verrucomicrobiota bacterium]
MTFRFILTIVIGLWLSQATAANHLLRVDAGQHERSITPVTFCCQDWLDALAAHRPRWQSGGHPGGWARLGLFYRRQTRRLRDCRLQAPPAAKATHGNAVNLSGKRASCGSLWATKPCCIIRRRKVSCRARSRTDLSPGGLHTPGRDTWWTGITDDYPHNHKHHHGIWFPWTNTIFEGRKPDFWNMGNGTGPWSSPA